MIGRLEGGMEDEDGSSRWITQSFGGYRINMIEHERVGLRKWFSGVET